MSGPLQPLSPAPDAGAMANDAELKVRLPKAMIRDLKRASEALGLGVSAYVRMVLLRAMREGKRAR